jgi:hypothetical protein
VLEKTGDRQRADGLEIVHWLKGEDNSRVQVLPPGTLLVNVETIILNKISVSTITPGKEKP